MARLLPLFPLQIVALPGGPVPLHIFEPRYREMVGDAAANGTEFGIVLAKNEGIVNTGCTVTVEEVVNRYPDGRFDVMTRGQRRFQIVGLDQEKDWLRGEVVFFDDEDVVEVEPALREQALASLTQLREVSGRPEDLAEPSHLRLSFQLAEEIDDIDFRLMQLGTRSERERLRQFIRFVESWIPRQALAARTKRTAGTNGFGHHPAIN
jgi:Lon protease-like protein